MARETKGVKMNRKVKSLYTFVFDWEGGTYISQVEARHPKEAYRNWAKQLEIQYIPGFTEAMRQEVQNAIETDDATPLEGLTNAWCFTVLISDKFGMGNIIKTERQ